MTVHFLSQETVQFVVLGMATGALYALFALGVVVTYRVSGVLNFAIGSLGAISAFFFYSMRDNHGVPWVLALILALLLGALIGMLTQVLVMVALRRASVVAKVIAMLGLLSLGDGLIGVIWGILPQGQPNSLLPTSPVRFTSQIVIPEDRLILIGLVVVAGVALRLVYTRTMFGMATSAVAENRRVAMASGWSAPLIELANFTLAGALAAGAAILLAPIVGLDASVLTLTVLPGLAAALVGRFSSFAATVAAALGIGVAGSLLSLFQTDIAHGLGWDPSALTGLPDVAPLLLIILAVTVRGRGRLRRGETLARLPLPGTGVVSPSLVAVVAVAGAVLVFTVPGTWAQALTTTFLEAILVLSVVVVTGLAGQLSLAQFALAGFGAWVAARLAATQGIPFELALVLGIAGTMLVGTVLAVLALRTRGISLAIATMAFALMISAVIFNNGSVTGGYLGTVVKPPTFLGLHIDEISYPSRYSAFVLVVLVLVGLAVANVRRGHVGRRLLAVRSNEAAAASLGIGVYGAKLYAFALASGIAAVAGILMGFRSTNVEFTNFDIFGSVNVVLYAVLGGIGWVSGAPLGALAVAGGISAMILSEIFHGVSNLSSWLLILAGGFTVIGLWASPNGLAALHAGRWQRMTRRVRRGLRLPTPGSRRPGEAAVRASRVRAPAALEVADVAVRFGGVVAVDRVSFRVQPGEIVGLIGPNGAGKTTLIDVITGFTRANEGSIRLDGQAVDGWSPERRARAGIARSWQAVELFGEMSVRENLLVAADSHSRVNYLTDLVRPGHTPATESMREVVRQFELEPYLEDRPAALSHGTSRLVGIARAIVTDPAILLLDEPAAGLDARESRELGAQIRALVTRTGVGVLIVEHDVELLLSISDRIVVLDFGRKIADGEPAEVASDPEVIRAYLGSSGAETSAGVHLDTLETESGRGAER